MFFKPLLSLSFLVLSTVTITVPVPAGGEIASRQSCSDVFVSFARGTTEVPTLGTVVGPGFSASLRTKLAARGKSLIFEGVPYPASISGFLVGGDEGGANFMAASVTSIANRCPHTKIVIFGYSQGAQIMHKAASRLSSGIKDRVAAAVIFGDPNQFDAYGLV